MQGSHLRCHNYSLELFAELVARVHHFVANVLGGNLPCQCVSNEHQFVCAQNDKLAVGHENPRGLGGADAAEESINGIEKGNVMGLTLVIVEAKQLPILRAHTAVCGREVLRGLPLGDVVLHRLCNFLFQQLELTQLQGRKQISLRVRQHAVMESNQGLELKDRNFNPSDVSGAYQM